ncbi:hypothetical protein CPB86DRAFT_799567 [Serendipita vermifera]|nr:hypothetical protein CPB86DRAFT_799567 [Serendipita vermifera]
MTNRLKHTQTDPWIQITELRIRRGGKSAAITQLWAIKPPRVNERRSSSAGITVGERIDLSRCSAVQTIAQAKPGTNQGESLRFLDTAFEFLDLDAQNTIQVQWIPGHHGIAGNERADAEAKAACQEIPTTTKTTLSHFYRTLRADFEQRWTTSWASHPKIREADTP